MNNNNAEYYDSQKNVGAISKCESMYPETANAFREIQAEQYMLFVVNKWIMDLVTLL